VSLGLASPSVSQKKKEKEMYREQRRKERERESYEKFREQVLNRVSLKRNHSQAPNSLSESIIAEEEYVD